MLLDEFLTKLEELRKTHLSAMRAAQAAYERYELAKRITTWGITTEDDISISPLTNQQDKIRELAFAILREEIESTKARFVAAGNAVITFAREHAPEMEAATLYQQCRTCGDKLVGHEDESTTTCRWCNTMTPSPPNAENQAAAK